MATLLTIKGLGFCALVLLSISFYEYIFEYQVEL